MPDIELKKIMKSRTFKVLRRTFLALGLVVCLVVAAVLSLPSVISSDWARGLLEQELSKTAEKPASVGALSFSWTDGLRLTSLLVGSGHLADANFMVSLEDLHINADILPLLRGDLRLAVELRDLRLRLPHTEPAPEPPAKPIPQALRELFATLRKGLAPLPMVVDAHVQIALKDMDVRIEPAPGGKALELRNISVFVETKGLTATPVTMKAGLDIVAGDAQPVPVRCSASAEGLKDASGRLNMAQARLAASCEVPGLDLTIGGSLAEKLKMDLRASPGEFLNVLRPLAASPLPELNGAIALSVTMSLPTPDRLDLGLVFFGDGLCAARGPLGGKTVGPISLSLLQEAALDLKAETVRLPGSLELKPSSRMRWVGTLDGVVEGKPRIALSLTETRLAVNELLPVVRAFLPPGLSMGQADLVLKSLNISSDLPAPGDSPRIAANVEGLEFTAANVVRRNGANQLNIGRTHLRLDSANVDLPGAMPGRAEATLSAAVEGLRLGGATPVSVRLFSLPRVALRVDALAQDARALFGLTGKAALELEALAKDIEAKGKAAIPSLTQKTRLLADLPANTLARVNLEVLDLDAPVLRVFQRGKKTVETPLNLHLSAPDISLSGSGMTPAVRGLKLNLDLGRALRCEALTSLDGQQGRDLRTEGTLTLDAQNLLALVSTVAPRQAKASGGLSVDWKLAATLPAPQPAVRAGAQGKPAAPKKLSQALKDLIFLHEAEAVLKLDGLSLDWPLAAAPNKSDEPGLPSPPAELLRLRGLSTPRPLRVSIRNGVAEASLAGSLAFGPMESLPGVGKLAKPLRGLMTINAAQQGARSVQLSQVLHLDGLELNQNLTLMLDKLDEVLDRDTDRLAAVLAHVDASFSFNVTTGLSALPARTAQSGMSGKGRIEAGAEARLSGGRSLALSARLVSPGMDLRLGPDMAISGLASSLRFSRRYSLSPGLRCGDDTESALAPLSEQVFDLSPLHSAPRAALGNEALGQLLRPDIARTAGGSIALAGIKLKSGGLPLDIRDMQARLDDSGPVPGLRSFRAGLLGGNILGSAMLRKNAGRYSLEADLAFTGIDPGRLLPDNTQRDLGAQAETAGRVTLSVPLTPDPEELLQRLSFRADITKIGPRTLERMLYALDPDEQNETIVQQRRLMGIGYPRYLRVAAAYGNLSLSGAVDVKGFQLDLPPVDRLAIANLPLKKQLAKPLAAVPGLIKLLDAASGSRICLDPASSAPGALRIIEQPSR